MDRSFFHFVTNHAFDRRADKQTDRRTDRILIASPRLHSMQRGNKTELEKLTLNSVHKIKLHLLYNR